MPYDSNAEFVAAETPHYRIGQQFADRRCQMHQGRVAGIVAGGIVEHLEIVHVELHVAYGPVGPVIDFVAQRLEKEGAGRHAGQRVAMQRCHGIMGRLTRQGDAAPHDAISDSEHDQHQGTG
jgi:hypothetical protein